MSLVRRALSKYRRDGLSELLRTVPSYLSTRYREELLQYRWRLVKRDELVRTANERGKLTWIDDEMTVQVDPPLSDIHPSQADKIGQRLVERTFVAEFSDVTILPPLGITRTRASKLLLETVANAEGFFKHIMKQRLAEKGSFSVAYESFRAKPSSSVPSPAVNMISRHENNFAHWLLEDLPMLYLVDKYRAETGVDPKLIVSEDLPGWALELLAILGYTQEDIIEWNGRPLGVSRLIVPTCRPMGSFYGELAPRARAWVASEIKSSVDYERHSDRFSSKVLISRQGQSRRQLHNHQEVIDALSHYGFEVYQPEDFSRAEQVALFANADIIVNPSGAAGVNIVFGDSLCFVELSPHQVVAPLGMEIAGECGHAYDYVVGTRDPPDQENRDPRNRDIVIDVQELRESIERCLDTQNK